MALRSSSRSTHREKHRLSHGSHRSSSHGQKKGKSRGLGTLEIVNLVMAVLYFVLMALTLWLMYSNNFLAFRRLNIIFTIVLVGIFIFSLVLIFTKKAKIFTTVILILFSVISATTLYGFRTAINLTNNLNGSSKYSEIQMSIVVPADSSIENINDVKTLATASASDQINIEEFINHLKDDKGTNPTLSSINSYQEGYEKLLSKEIPAMIWSSAYESLIALEDEDYESKIKKIYSYTIRNEKESEDTKGAETLNGDSFNIYISGIDTYGSISSVSRSDVNIIMTVNQDTHKILLTTTPRDSYVQIPDGGGDQYDKLTHAGIYGVNTSMKTLENLYNINLDYYVRLNFTSFLELIDVLGGVEVYNDQAFNSHIGNYDFEVGDLTLDSEHALAFVRERYSLEGGDNDRGKNQEKVIAAVINKLAKVNSITKFQSIINTLEQSMETNIPLDQLMTLANRQLDSSETYKVSSQAIEGSGSTGRLTSYAMPGSSLYMLEINEDSLDKAKSEINKVLEGN